MTAEDEPPVLYANVAYDPTVWVEIPVMWEPESWPGPDAWAQHMAMELWAGLDATSDDIAKLELALAFWAERVVGAYSDVPIEIQNFLHLPDPAGSPLLVRVWVDDEPEATVEEVTEVQDPEAVEPPLAEQFQTEHLGPGLRVLRYRPLDPPPGGLADSGALYAVLRYGFKIPDHDAVITVTTSCADLGYLIKAMDDLDAFVRAIQWDYEPRDLEPA